ncbi:MAG: ATP-binding protein, partial [Candidatus Omnitrophica bacterium]|nr:ATP-binding protein [Candidatus Omnitrophota bacterium]
IIASLIGFSGGATNYPLIFNLSVYPMGHPLVALYAIIITYAIIKYRLMDITVALTSTGIFAVVYTIILGLPFVAIKFLKPILMPLWGSNWWLAILILGMTVASVGPFIYMYFQRRATAFILREERRTHSLLIKASEGLVNIRELKRLLKTIVSFITKTMHITNAVIYLWDKEEQVYRLESIRFRSGFKEYSPIEAEDPLISLLKERKESLVLEELKLKREYVDVEEVVSQMKDLSAAVIIPSFIEDTLLGFLVLGEKKSGRMYTSNDLAVLSVLSNQAGLAIENAIFYEEQGKTLAQQFQEHRLKSLGKMGSGIGHQINNRFQAISMTAGSTQMLDVQELKKTNLSEEQRKLIEGLEKSLNDIVQECLRGGNIARSLTQFSRTHEEFKPVNLAEIIEGTLNLLSCKFNIEDLHINLDYAKDIPPILGNLALLQDIFFNHLDNAHDACLAKDEEIKKGNLKAEEQYTPKVSVKAFPIDGLLHIEISDNGIGMTEEQLDQAFIPFFTTKATSQKGTGLGLSIIKKIIDAHRGTISVVSEYGKGTTFTITLPLAQ